MVTHLYENYLKTIKTLAFVYKKFEGKHFMIVKKGSNLAATDFDTGCGLLSAHLIGYKILYLN